MKILLFLILHITYVCTYRVRLKYLEEDITNLCSFTHDYVLMPRSEISNTYNANESNLKFFDLIGN